MSTTSTTSGQASTKSDQTNCAGTTIDKMGSAIKSTVY